MSIKIEIEFKSHKELFEAIDSKIVQINAFGYAITLGKYPNDTVTILNAYDDLCNELKQLFKYSKHSLIH